MRSEENRGKMVAHAVQVEPVSIAEFPANREINRDIRQIGSREPISIANTRAKLQTCGKISLRNRTGNYFGETGYSHARIGNFLLPMSLERASSPSRTSSREILPVLQP